MVCRMVWYGMARKGETEDEWYGRPMHLGKRAKKKPCPGFPKELIVGEIQGILYKSRQNLCVKHI